ncbi:MAG: Nif3-like dinuclear metal center hexameric protein [Cytophagales bacterium]|nr:Nif3-like dinuclear metal center hexameric protein [Bernardetiaceae bacterium]MDW8203634.1 Nif3-like dinuclear metal center hexameric protein [Cytophagales bacterium]
MQTLTVGQVVSLLNQLAPPAWQEQYDNAGLITGEDKQTVQGILISLDATEKVVQEALSQHCNLIIAHHPIVFAGLKKINGRNYVERTLIKAIKHDIAIYAIHTNLDNVLQGVNHHIANQIGLTNQKILLPKPHSLQKLSVFVPVSHTDIVRQAISEAGAGQIGNYSHCTFTLRGEGTFKPNDRANPFVGKAHQLERVEEDRLEAIFPAPLQNKIVAAMRAVHPYEEVAFDIYPLANENPEVGAGMVGDLPKPMEGKQFLQLLKETFQTPCIRHTQLLDKPVQRVAVCGGSGSFLLSHAIAAGADFFVTADFKYHQFFDADGKIVIADIGHYESEIGTTQLLQEFLQQQLPVNIPIKITTVNTNPVCYF